MRGLGLLAVTSLLCGCSSNDFTVGAGTVSDSGSAVADSGETVDSGATVDGGADTSDGGVTDAGLDTGVDVGIDVGTTCPRPASTATFNLATTACEKLLAAYVEEVNAAKVCACDGDCSTTLYDSLCKNCESFVSPANEAYARAKAILEEWNARVAAGMCAPPPCPASLCAPPVLSGCHGSGPGTPQTCLKK